MIGSNEVMVVGPWVVCRCRLSQNNLSVEATRCLAEALRVSSTLQILG